MRYSLYQTPIAEQPKTSSSSKCSVNSHTCSATDDVNDPVYNIKNVIKQTILLEEHLAEKEKYCQSCIVKHFLHISGLLEEAIWMAGSKHYDYLSESITIYSTLFEEWQKNKTRGEHTLVILSKLREHRQKLIQRYYL